MTANHETPAPPALRVRRWAFIIHHRDHHLRHGVRGLERQIAKGEKSAAGVPISTRVGPSGLPPQIANMRYSG